MRKKFKILCFIEFKRVHLIKLRVKGSNLRIESSTLSALKLWCKVTFLFAFLICNFVINTKFSQVVKTIKIVMILYKILSNDHKTIQKIQHLFIKLWYNKSNINIYWMVRVVVIPDIRWFNWSHACHHFISSLISSYEIKSHV